MRTIRLHIYYFACLDYAKFEKTIDWARTGRPYILLHFHALSFSSQKMHSTPVAHLRDSVTNREQMTCLREENQML